MTNLGVSEWIEIVVCLALAAVILWQHRTLSELIWGAYRAAPVWTVTLPLLFIGLAVLLFWHFFSVTR